MKLNKNNIPIELHHLIPLAEKFGISDDGYRLEQLEKTSEEEIEELKSSIDKYDDQFDEWLAGPEAKGHEFTTEYIAFSALRMAADES